MSRTVLNSWKEIAGYLGRGVRTVQRWERDLDLPVHRPWGRTHSTVLALPEELDAWVRSTATLREIPVDRKDTAKLQTIDRRANQMGSPQQRTKQLLSRGFTLQQDTKSLRQLRERTSLRSKPENRRKGRGGGSVRDVT
jgi:hypothetical protein